MTSALRSTNPFSKRVFDFLASLLALVILSPILLLLFILVWLFLGEPVIFSQARPGLHGSIFHLYKFRTMRDLRDPSGNLLPDEQRLTRFGRFLRSSSLDELPELINVLKGEMSLVGPRPLLVQYLDRYTPEQTRRHEVLPGITGWAQVNGRNALTWEEKFALDIWYVDHRTFWLDIRILFMTLVKAFKREGISAPGSATAPEFMGTEKK
jgi:lipopolysaccharide/colanic/teichoic acid biosynthesis glycosyltransferase